MTAIDKILCPDCANDTLDPDPGEQGQYCEDCGETFTIAECVLVDADGSRVRTEIFGLPVSVMDVGGLIEVLPCCACACDCEVCNCCDDCTRLGGV